MRANHACCCRELLSTALRMLSKASLEAMVAEHERYVPFSPKVTCGRENLPHAIHLVKHAAERTSPSIDVCWPLLRPATRLCCQNICEACRHTKPRTKPTACRKGDNLAWYCTF